MATELTGVNDVMNNIASILERMPGLTRNGVIDCINDIGARAVEKAPVDAGTLRSSMGLWLKQEGDTIIGEISFNEKYAAYQHEHVELNHPKGGECKYLERAALEKYDMIAEEVAASLSALFGGGFR